MVVVPLLATVAFGWCRDDCERHIIRHRSLHSARGDVYNKPVGRNVQLVSLLSYTVSIHSVNISVYVADLVLSDYVIAVRAR